jgi:hypothetical protein
MEQGREKCLAEEEWIREDYLVERLQSVFELIRARFDALVSP